MPTAARHQAQCQHCAQQGQTQRHPGTARAKYMVALRPQHHHQDSLGNALFKVAAENRIRALPGASGPRHLQADDLQPGAHYNENLAPQKDPQHQARLSQAGNHANHDRYGQNSGMPAPDGQALGAANA